MDNFERALGRVEEGISTLKKDVSDIKRSMLLVQKFQWKQAGAYLILSAITGGLVSFAAAIISR